LNDWISATVLAVIEGLTEFLPVSSTGHMILAMPQLGVDEHDPKWKVFLYVSQLGAILAVVAYFWRDLVRRVALSPARWREHLVTKLAAAMVPTVILGLLFNDFMEEHFEEGPYAPLIVAGALIIGAGLILWIDRVFRREVDMTVEQITLRQAMLVGLFQCLAMVPGTSRSGATIMGGMMLGLTPRVATEFSFYLAIPTMLAASGLRVLKHAGTLTSESIGLVLFGTAVSFVVALGVVAAFMNYVRRRKFTPFAIYRVLLGLAVIVWYYAS